MTKIETFVLILVSGLLLLLMWFLPALDLGCSGEKRFISTPATTIEKEYFVHHGKGLDHLVKIKIDVPAHVDEVCIAK